MEERNGRPGRRSDAHFSQADYNFKAETAARTERIRAVRGSTMAEDAQRYIPGVKNSSGLSQKEASEVLAAQQRATQATLDRAENMKVSDEEVAASFDAWAGPSIDELDAIFKRAHARVTGSDRRSAILDQVRACVCRDRQNTYGDAEGNFADIAALATIVLAAKLKEPLEAVDVATFSACIKLARIKTSPDHLDNWVDLAGYAVCGGGIVESKKDPS